MGIRVLIVDDQSLIRQGTEAVLRGAPGMTVVGIVGTAREAVEEACRRRPDVVLIEVGLRNGDGVSAIRAIRDRCPDTNILVVTQQNDPAEALRSIESGAVGYVLKDISPENLIRAVEHVASGKTMLNPSVARYVVAMLAARSGHAVEELKGRGLTSREVEILLTLGRGMSDREIASHLYLSKATVKTHLKAIYRKLRVKNRSQAAVYGASRGLLDVQ